MTLDGKIKGDGGDEKRGFVLAGLRKMNASDIAKEFEQNTMTTTGGFKSKMRRLVLN